jgi:transcriptional regulator with XRE-family HTH domain
MAALEVHYGQLVGLVIRGRRETLGLPMTQMAECMKMTASGWSRLETGDTAITLEQVRRAARWLETTVGDLIAQADALTGRLEALGVEVHNDKKKGMSPLTAAKLLALLT